MTIAARFWSKVDRRGPDECWPWRAALRRNGYGVFSRGARGAGQALAHRVAYEIAFGAIPAGLVLDHVCRNRSCVNPAHLEAVTMRENTMRSEIAPATINARKTHCIHGHPLSGENLYVHPKGYRYCRTCKRAS